MTRMLAGARWREEMRNMPADGREIVVGKIVGAFGIRGEVKLVPLTDFPERFGVGNTLRLRMPKGELRETKVASAREQKGGITAKLDGVDTRDQAEELSGAEVVIDRSEAGSLPEGSFYLFDIVGLKVVTDDGREQGVVTEVLTGGANDVYVTSTGLCIPALKWVVASVDVAAGVMVIRPVPGLLPGE